MDGSAYLYPSTLQPCLGMGSYLDLHAKSDRLLEVVALLPLRLDLLH